MIDRKIVTEKQTQILVISNRHMNFLIMMMSSTLLYMYIPYEIFPK